MPVAKFKSKKRPRRFFGTPTARRASAGSTPHSPGAEEAVTPVQTPEERPIPLETASSKKLAISRSFPSSSGPSRALQPSSTAGESEPSGSESDSEPLDSVKEMKGYRIVDCETLGRVVSEACVCSVCTSPLVVMEVLAQRRGLVSTMKICCTNTECGKESKISDPYSPESKSFNARSVLAMREFGRGRTYMDSFFGMMDMLPPVSAPSYMLHSQALADASMSAANDNMIAASAYLHRLKGVEPDDILDVKVTCDGTWSRRGFSAIHGLSLRLMWRKRA